MGETREITPADLRGILKYVPQWRGHIFVISVDSAILEDANLPNILRDIAVLRNLNVKVVLVHGIGEQLRRRAEATGIPLSDASAHGPVDRPTLELAISTAAVVSHQLVQGLTANGLKCVLTNAVRATEVGILQGRDQLARGKVERVDAPFLLNLLESEVVPLISPLAFNRDGRPLRLHCDALAAAVANALKASKVIFLAALHGLELHGQYTVNIRVDDLRAQLDRDPEALPADQRDKARFAISTVDGGTPRAHIIDGRLADGMLTEIFSKVGVGTMIYANEYQRIRPARRGDLAPLVAITREGARRDELRPRTAEEIEAALEHFFVYEIDQSIIGCVALFPHDDRTAEIESVSVQPFYQGRGVGQKLVEFAVFEAARRGFSKIVALTTQSYAFFRYACGFSDGSADDLPPARQQALANSGRGSRVLIKEPRIGDIPHPIEKTSATRE